MIKIFGTTFSFWHDFNFLARLLIFLGSFCELLTIFTVEGSQNGSCNARTVRDFTFGFSRIYGRVYLQVHVDLDDVDIVEDYCCYRSPESGCLDEFTQFASIIMQEQNLNIPETAKKALVLYSTLHKCIDELH